MPIPTGCWWSASRSPTPATRPSRAWTLTIRDPAARRRAFDLLSTRPFLNSGFAAGTARTLLAYLREADRLLHSSDLLGTADWGDQTALNLYCYSVAGRERGPRRLELLHARPASRPVPDRARRPIHHARRDADRRRARQREITPQLPVRRLTLNARVWHFTDPRRFTAFCKATELYELNVTNRLTLEYRTLQGQKAGLTKSVGFKVVENKFLRGVLEFSSESSAPLDEHIFRAISNIGFQLGQVFAQERLRERHRRLQKLMLSRDADHDAISRVLFSGKASLSAEVASLETLRRSQKALAASAKDIVESTYQMRKHLDELRRLVAKPIVLPPSLAR